MLVNKYRYFVPKNRDVRGTDIFKRGPQKPHKEDANAIASRARAKGFKARVVKDAGGYTVWVNKHKSPRLSR